VEDRSVEADCPPHVVERIVGLVPFERDAEVLAKRSESEVGGWCQRLVFVKRPHGPLHRAEHAWRGRQEQVHPLVPGTEKRTVEFGIVGHELGDLKHASAGRGLVDRRMPHQQVRERLSNDARRTGLTVPAVGRVVILAKCLRVGNSLVEMQLGLERFQLAPVTADRNGRNLDDGSPFDRPALDRAICEKSPSIDSNCQQQLNDGHNRSPKPGIPLSEWKHFDGPRAD